MLVRDIRDLTAEPEGAHPGVRRVAVAPAARIPPVPPLVLGPASHANLWDISEPATPPAECYAVMDAIVAPAGIVIANGVAFHGETFLLPRHLAVAVSDRLNAASLPRRHIGGALAVILGPAHETWGHWLVDFLPRLWVMQAAGWDLAALRFLVPDDLRDFAADLLDLAGLPPGQLVVYRHWQEVISADCVVWPAGLRRHNRFAACFRDATDFWVERLRRNAGISPATAEARLFLSRKAAPQDRVLENRDDIAALAAARGLRVVTPERLDIAGQAALFSGARLIAGEYGSALHNSVFMGPGARVLALRGTFRHPDFVQTGIATALCQRLAYVFGASSGSDTHHRFSVDPAWFERAWKRMAPENHEPGFAAAGPKEGRKQSFWPPEPKRASR